MYRERIELLATGGLVEAHLDAWAAERSVAAGPWRRVYGKLKPQRSPWAVLVYEAAGGPTVRVRLLESTDDRAANGLGEIEISSCEDDPALPGLPAVLAALDEPVVVRYRPGNRCTVRGNVEDTGRYVKILTDAVDDQVEARARWDATRAGVLSFAVAEPHGWDGRTQSSWYGVVPGNPLLPHLAGPDGARAARAVGRSLGELAVAPLRPRASVDAAEQLVRTGRGLRRAAAAAPALADELRRAGDALARAHQDLGSRPLVPAHGAAHMNQWLVDDDGRLGLVDFDRFALGDPEFDVATFLVELRAESSALLLPYHELETAVLDGFRETGGELDEQRLRLYARHKQLSKVTRTAAALRPGAEQRAGRELAELLASDQSSDWIPASS
ncbi:MAG TPA: phosphotransferase [Nocardioidaceae bacterium]|nr:phosphotransferase [Nocardioidaceae bacterium]